MNQKKFLSFKEARKFARSLKLKNVDEWIEYRRSGKKPDDIPGSPSYTYSKEWKGYPDWLGNGQTSFLNRWSYERSKACVQKLKIKTQNQFNRLSRARKLPSGIPSRPGVYKEWKGWGDFLGTGRIANQNKEYGSYKETSKFAQKHGIKTQDEWRDYIKSNELPPDIPRDPFSLYKKTGEWKSWGDFLGTGNVSAAKKSKGLLSAIEAKTKARMVAKKLGVKTVEDWNNAYVEGKIPDDLPRDLYNAYGRGMNVDDKRRMWREQYRRNKGKKK